MNDSDPFLLPKCDHSVETAISNTALSQNVVVKKKRLGKEQIF